MKSIKTYSLDKRAALEKLYLAYSKLKKHGWTEKTIYTQTEKINNKNISIPILSYKTRKKGKSLWIISGIHGEEPAGPNAIAENINYINKLAEKGIPIILLPLCNPKGYRKDWRYPGKKNAASSKEVYDTSESVGSSEHYLPSLKNPLKPRMKKPASKEAEAITAHILKLSKEYPPLLVIDFHEDKSNTNSYIYSQGKLWANDPVAKEIVKILQKNKIPIQLNGKTRFKEEIINGIVSNIHDSSIDELLASENIILNNKLARGPSAKSVIVTETQRSTRIKLKKRIKADSEIILSLEKFWKTANSISFSNF